MSFEQIHQNKESIEFSPDRVRSVIGKGEHYEPSPTEFVLDTGDFDIGSEGDPYINTINAGVIDHHRIDNIYTISGEKDFEPKCSTKIVLEYADHISKIIQEKGIDSTVTHTDGDLDSITSSYLVQALIQNNKLPAGSQTLAEHVNSVDYGMYRESSTEKYTNSLSGIFSVIKGEISKVRDETLSKEVFNNPMMKSLSGRLTDEGLKKLIEIKSLSEIELNQIIFTILNFITSKSSEDLSFNPEKDMDKLVVDLPEDIKSMIERGAINLRVDLEKFNQDFEKCERRVIKVKVPKSDKEIEVPIIISVEPISPALTFTNLAYQRVSPNTIVAVYAGPKRSGGDMYDIGIMPESAELIDLGQLCVALNKAEKVKRENLAKDDEIIKKLESQPDRLGMSGPEQIITKDPTVLVAGGTLIAASRNSLLTSDDFREVIEKL